MNKNLMPEIMKMLGVEYNEKFQLDNYGTESAKGNLFCFNENNGLLMVYPDGVSCSANELVYGILCGYYKIVKLPWEPKYKEYYYSPSITQRRGMELLWLDDTRDYTMKAINMVYRTKEEAEANLSKDYERLTGKPLSSR